MADSSFLLLLLLLMANDEGGYLLRLHLRQLVRHPWATITPCRRPSTNSRCLFRRTCPTCCRNNSTDRPLRRRRLRPLRILPTRTYCRRRPDLSDVPNPPTRGFQAAANWHHPNRAAKTTATTTRP